MSDPLPTASNSPHPRRRRWAVSLRGLMLLILVVGGLFGWWIREATLRREALAALREVEVWAAFGDQPGYEDKAGLWTWLYRRTGVEGCREIARIGYELPRRPARPPGGPPDPTPDDAFRELGRVGRSGALGRVGEVEIRDVHVTPAHLRELAAVRTDRLVFYNLLAVTASMLGELGRIGSLKHLTLGTRQGAFNPAVLRTDAGMDRLETLKLYGFARLDGADLVPLGELPNLQALGLIPAPRDEAYLDRVGTAGGLTTLDLAETRVSDAGLRRLVARSPRLEAITLDGLALTDAGVEALAGLPRLRSVNLAGRFGVPPGGALTDASLVALGRLPGLAELQLNSGHFTDRGIDALQGLPLRTLRLGSIEALGAATLARLLAGRTYAFLGLRGPGVTDATVATLGANFRGRMGLDLSFSAVTDASMPTLGALSLGELDLIRTAVTDQGLAMVPAASTLSFLNLWDTPVTLAGAAAFRFAHQDSQLYVGPTPEHSR